MPLYTETSTVRARLLLPRAVRGHSTKIGGGLGGGGRGLNPSVSRLSAGEGPEIEATYAQILGGTALLAAIDTAHQQPTHTAPCSIHAKWASGGRTGKR